MAFENVTKWMIKPPSVPAGTALRMVLDYTPTDAVVASGPVGPWALESSAPGEIVYTRTTGESEPGSYTVRWDMQTSGTATITED